MQSSGQRLSICLWLAVTGLGLISSIANVTAPKRHVGAVSNLSPILLEDQLLNFLVSPETKARVVNFRMSSRSPKLVNVSYAAQDGDSAIFCDLTRKGREQSRSAIWEQAETGIFQNRFLVAQSRREFCHLTKLILYVGK
jgi:hypothetical protein